VPLDETVTLELSVIVIPDDIFVLGQNSVVGLVSNGSPEDQNCP
jgi:hypothetical protein